MTVSLAKKIASVWQLFLDFLLTKAFFTDNMEDKQDVVHDIFGQKEDSYRVVLDNKVKSHKTRSDSSNLSAESQMSMQSLNNRGSFLPEPLPLFDGPAEDNQNLLQGLRRATKIFKNDAPNDVPSSYCSHE